MALEATLVETTYSKEMIENCSSFFGWEIPIFTTSSRYFQCCAHFFLFSHYIIPTNYEMKTDIYILELPLIIREQLNMRGKKCQDGELTS